jgi:hypothetical protein
VEYRAAYERNEDGVRRSSRRYTQANVEHQSEARADNQRLDEDNEAIFHFLFFIAGFVFLGGNFRFVYI